MSAATYVELGIIARSRQGFEAAAVDEALARWGVCDRAPSPTQARLAIEAFAAFGKGLHPARLNYGDCFAYALAKERGEPLLFKGSDFARTDIVAAILGQLARDLLDRAADHGLGLLLAELLGQEAAGGADGEVGGAGAHVGHGLSAPPARSGPSPARSGASPRRRSRCASAASSRARSLSAWATMSAASFSPSCSWRWYLASRPLASSCRRWASSSSARMRSARRRGRPARSSWPASRPRPRG